MAFPPAAVESPAELPALAVDGAATAAGSALAGAGEAAPEAAGVAADRPMFPRGCPSRKPELSYQQHPKSEGPCQRLSCWPWALSEVLSIELEGIDWQYESVLAHAATSALSVASTAAVRIENSLSLRWRLNRAKLTQQPQKATVPNTA